MLRPTAASIASLALLVLAPAIAAAQPLVRVLNLPAGYYAYQESQVVLDGDVGYLDTQNATTNRGHLWSFSVATGALLDPDGLELAVATGVTPTRFAGQRLALSGYWYGYGFDGVGVIDFADPTNLQLVGVIPLPPIAQPLFFQTKVIGDPNGTLGFVAGQNFLTGATSRLFSFDVASLSALDPDGVPLPGYSDLAALAGDRFVMPDLDDPGVVVVDVSDPSALAVAGHIAFPAGETLNGANNPVASADGQTAFVATDKRRVYSFDLDGLAVRDPDGQAYGNNGLVYPGFQVEGMSLTRVGDRLAAVAGNGLSFLDVATPDALALLADADFGYPQPGMQGSAVAAWSADGEYAAIATFYTDYTALNVRLFAFRAATGERVRNLPLCEGQQQVNHVIRADDDTVLALCASSSKVSIWMFTNLFTALSSDDFESATTAKWLVSP